MFVMDYYGHKLSNGVLFAHHLILDVPGGSSHLGYRRRVPLGHNPGSRVKDASRPAAWFESATPIPWHLGLTACPRTQPLCPRRQSRLEGAGIGGSQCSTGLLDVFLFGQRQSISLPVWQSLLSISFLLTAKTTNRLL